MTRPVVAGAVLAGGASRRFGADKASALLDGSPLVHRPLAALAAAGASPVVLVGGSPALAPPGVAHVVDDEPGGGPLPALVQALGLAGRADLVVVLACDLPGASPAEVAHLVSCWSPGLDVVVPVVDGRRQWLHAAWSVAARPSLVTAQAGGARSIRDAARGLRRREVEPVDAAALADVDRAEDLARYARADRGQEDGP